MTILLFLSYFLIPTLYNKEKIRTLFEKQILEKYNLKVKIHEKLSYGLLPSPHFVTRGLTIIHDEKDLVYSNKTKIFISVKNFFTLDSIKINELFFINNEFNIKLL